jgi:hypothetical protein
MGRLSSASHPLLHDSFATLPLYDTNGVSHLTTHIVNEQGDDCEKQVAPTEVRGRRSIDFRKIQ